MLFTELFFRNVFVQGFSSEIQFLLGFFQSFLRVLLRLLGDSLRTLFRNQYEQFIRASSRGSSSVGFFPKVPPGISSGSSQYTFLQKPFWIFSPEILQEFLEDSSSYFCSNRFRIYSLTFLRNFPRPLNQATKKFFYEYMQSRGLSRFKDATKTIIL